MFFSHISTLPSFYFHSFSSHPASELFLIQSSRPLSVLSVFHHLPFSCTSKVFLATVESSWILHSLLPLWFPRPRLCSSPRTLPPRQSQLPSTLSNTPVYYANTQTQTRTQALTCTRTEACMRARINSESARCVHTQRVAEVTFVVCLKV